MGLRILCCTFYGGVGGMSPHHPNLRKECDRGYLYDQQGPKLSNMSFEAKIQELDLRWEPRYLVLVDKANEAK